MKNVVLERLIFSPTRVLGRMSVYDDFLLVTVKTLELPWLNNERRRSCIPLGKYKLVKRTSTKYGDHFWVKDVPDRSMVLIHSGNSPKDTEGCILPGEGLANIDDNEELEVISSKRAMKLLNDILDDENQLYIIYQQESEPVKHFDLWLL